ncbi:PepSY-associated TM helix domain-containing protein [Methylorubrum extorquens]|uniref:PepSY-associated TM helix domain protein n=1 Tax=Methylorubrum extorquens DSM 13060 TaxID=882800 RepID=H1KCV9_METEX|nr:PepSY domain-containing protein [Methylorubrum extorquens]EHP94646.1 PepSY-associated TM helix domain protein [Methylorubrum extorquens DSM 13060]
MSQSLQGDATAFSAVVAARPAQDAVYRAVWRWHFYAGLLCLPFLILLSATGSLYLFKVEINGTLFAYRTTVAPQASRPLSPDVLLFNASQAEPAAVPVSMADPADPTAAAVVTMAEGSRRTLVYLNPYNGDVLDRFDRDGEFMMVVRRLHSLAYFGTVANGVIEVVAGFAIILVVTGTYLWWPRRQSGGVVSVRGTPRKRVWWRDLHAVTGLVAGAGLFFLAATGLPWSAWWGQQVRTLSNEAGVGQPRALWANKPVSNVPMQEMLTTTGWAMVDAPVPVSQPSAAASIGLARAVEILRGLGMPAGFEISLPVGETGVYAAAAYPKDVAAQRMVSLDQYTGKPLVDVRFDDLGGVARAIQYGIGIHKGEHWGRANQLAMLAFCLATILLSVTAAVMWWKRRPAGRLGVPPWPRDRRVAATVTVIVLGLGALFPLTGLAILVMVVVDLAIQALRPRLAS